MVVSTPTSRVARSEHERRRKHEHMITLGVVLLILGLLTHVAIFRSIGVLLVLVGAILWILGAAGRQVGGRRHYYQLPGARGAVARRMPDARHPPRSMATRSYS